MKNLISQNLLDELIDILKICDAAKYSPAYRLEKDTIITKTKCILNKLDKSLK